MDARRRPNDIPRFTEFDGTTANVGYSRHIDDAPELAVASPEDMARLDARLRSNKLASTNPFLSDDLETRQKVIAEYQKNAEVSLREAINPSTTAKRKLILTLWSTMLSQTAPHIKQEDYWLDSVVDRYWSAFAEYLVESLQGKYSLRVKSRTLVSMVGTLLNLILINMVAEQPDGSRRKCGSWYAANHQLDFKLKAFVQQLTKKHKLPRHHERRLYFGRAEFALIVQTCMANLDDPALDCFQESFVKILLTFYTTARPSTLGPVYPGQVEAEQFFKLRHITIFCHARGEWSVQIRFMEYKAHLWSSNGTEQTFNLEHCNEPHNLLFDLPIWLITAFYKRGVFQEKYKSIDELVDDPNAVLAFDPEKLDEPVFPKWNSGGRERAFPVVPQSASAISQSTRYLCELAGLASVGTTAWRRDAGDAYGVQLGSAIAKDILHHDTEGPFRDHYSRNTANYDVVGARLGEKNAIPIPGASIGIPRRSKNTNATAPATWAVINVLKGTIPPTGARLNALATNTATSRTDPEASSSRLSGATSAKPKAPRAPPFDSEEIRLLWIELQSCLETPVSYKRNVALIAKVMALPMLEGKEDEAKEVEGRLRAAYHKGTVDRRHAKRRADRQSKAANRETVKGQQLPKASRAHKNSAVALTTATRVPSSAADVFKSMLDSDGQDDIQKGFAVFENTAVETIALRGNAFSFDKHTQEEKDAAKSLDLEMNDLMHGDDDDELVEVPFRKQETTGDVEAVHEVFRDSNMPEARIEVLRYLINSGIEAKMRREELSKHSVRDAKGNIKGYSCAKCGIVINGSTSAKLRHHMAAQHSDFVELLDTIVTGKDKNGNSIFDCPYGDFRGFKRSQAVDHMIDSCMHREHARFLHDRHRAGVNEFKEAKVVANKVKSAQLVGVDRWSSDLKNDTSVRGLFVPESRLPHMQVIDETRQHMELLSVLDADPVTAPTIEIITANMERYEARILLKEHKRLRRIRYQQQCSR